MNGTKLKGNLMLLLTAFIWGTAFVAQKSGMDYVGPFTFNGIRTFIGAIALIPVIMMTAGKPENGETSGNGCAGESGKSSKRRLIISGTLCGILLFIGGSLQQVALQYTPAGKAGFITALYIVLVPVLGIFLKNKVRPIAWLCVTASAAGLFLLCVPAGESFSTVGKGEIMLFVSAFFFAAQMLLVDKVVKNLNGLHLSQVEFIACGTLSIPFIIMEAPSLSAIASCWFPFLYAGVLSVGVGYTFQILAQKNTDPTSASLILSLESVFSVLAGAVVLHEQMTGREILGCAIMFASIIVSQLPEKKNAGGADEKQAADEENVC